MSDSGLILPDTVAPQGEKTMVMPSTVKTWNCLVCGENFLHRHKYRRHVPLCAKKHREGLITVSEEHQAEVDADPFQKVWDPEALEWVLKQRRRRERG